MIVSRKTAEEAAKTLLVHSLFLSEQLTENMVNQAYRSRARETHPDVCGDPAEFVAVDRAKHVLQHWLTSRTAAAAPDVTAGLCDACGGAGHIRVRAGFSSGFRRQCLKCRGSGDANYDHDHTVN